MQCNATRATKRVSYICTHRALMSTASEMILVQLGQLHCSYHVHIWRSCDSASHAHWLASVARVASQLHVALIPTWRLICAARCIALFRTSCTTCVRVACVRCGRKVGSGRPVSCVQFVQVSCSNACNWQIVSSHLISSQTQGRPKLGISNGEHSSSNTEKGEIVQKKRKIAYYGEGMNLYIRIGAGVFTLGTISYKLIRILEPFETGVTDTSCLKPFSTFVDVIFVVFIMLQTFLIFKHHQVVIHRYKAPIRLCLMHLLATNIAIWVSACAKEIMEGLPAHAANETVLAIDGEVLCESANGQVSVAAAYLFPCIIEYSLIGAAAIYRIYLNVAKQEDKSRRDDDDKKSTLPFSCTNNVVHKGHWGTIVGVTVACFTVVSVVIFYILESHNDVQAAVFLFLSVDITLLSLALVTVIIMMKRLRQLAFITREIDSFDDKLLMLTLCGYYFYSFFLVLSNAEFNSATKTALYLVREAITFVQITLQVIVILDGFRRRAGSDDDVKTRPGRGVIMLLLACNLALWISNTFEIKRAEIADLTINYSEVAWRLVINFTLPLVIFHRFHATICLSDIWEKAYKKDT